MKLNFSAVMQSHMRVWFGFQILYWVFRFYICNWCRGTRPPSHIHTHTHTGFRLRCVFQIGKINSFRIVVLLSTNACVSEKYPLNSLLLVFFHLRLWFAVIQKRRFSWGVRVIPAAFDTGLHSSWSPFPFTLWTQFHDRCLQVVNFSCFLHFKKSNLQLRFL